MKRYYAICYDEAQNLSIIDLGECRDEAEVWERRDALCVGKNAVWVGTEPSLRFLFDTIRDTLLKP